MVDLGSQKSSNLFTKKACATKRLKLSLSRMEDKTQDKLSPLPYEVGQGVIIVRGVVLVSAGRQALAICFLHNCRHKPYVRVLGPKTH